MNKWVKKVARLLIILAVMGSTGCPLVLVGAGAGAALGTAEYVRGELKQAYAAPMAMAWNASLATVDELKMKVTEKSIDNLDQNRVIKGETKEGKDFQMALEALSKEVTMVKVRIGLFGDEAYSKGIQEVIAKNLKK